MPRRSSKRDENRVDFVAAMEDRDFQTLALKLAYVFLQSNGLAK